jgi:hypothetical protein
LRLTADDKLVAYLNGERLGSHNTWRSVREFNVTKRLRPGKNLLAVRAENVPAPQANPAGLLCALEIVQDGKVTNIASDNSWHVTKNEEPGWTNVVFNDESWGAAKVIAKYGEGPWERLPEAAYRKYMVPYVAGVPGIARVIYLPESRRFVVRGIEGVSAYEASWFDPVSGAGTRIGSVSPNARGEWTAPAPPGEEQDWVLIMRTP